MPITSPSVLPAISASAASMTTIPLTDWLGESSRRTENNAGQLDVSHLMQVARFMSKASPDSALMKRCQQIHMIA